MAALEQLAGYKKRLVLRNFVTRWIVGAGSYIAGMTKAKKSPDTQTCPACGSESWRIMYGMMMPDVREQYPKAVFAGCVVMEEERLYPATGIVERGVPEWACRNPMCGHRWW